jgi:CheY-like chemotaxis protein
LARRILLADDSVTAQNMGRRILTDAGYEVVTVNNGSAALKKIAENRPDLIVLDVYMPGYGGLEVCQRIKESPDTGRIPVLLTVGKLEPFKPEEARRVRADAFIVKPFEATELLTALTKLEDKIVAQPQPQKSGRFAKALAAVEQSERGERFGDQETGWKSRLTIPDPNAKPKAAQTEVPDAVATAVSAPAALGPSHEGGPGESPREFERPIPAGLPADITAEEIAAITAAAAAFGGKAETIAAPDISAVSAAAGQEVASAATAAAPPAEAEAPGMTLASAVGAVEKVQPEAHAETTQVVAETIASSEVAQVEAAQPEVTKTEVPNAEMARTEVARTENQSAALELPAPASEVNSGIRPEATQTDAAIRAGDAEVWAALASLAPSNGHAVETVRPAEDSASTRGEVPAVLAGAMAASAQATGPRWIAEAVTVPLEESTLALELEMQRASASPAVIEAAAANISFAAAVESPAPAAVAEPEPVPIAAPIAVETTVAEAAVAAQSVAEPTVPEAERAEPSLTPTAEPVLAQSAEPTQAEGTEPAVAEPEAAYAAAASANSSAAPMSPPAPVSPASTLPASRESQTASSAESAPQREAELAAAWQNWKQIRESGVEARPSPQIAEVLAEGSRREEVPPAAPAPAEPVAEAAEVETAGGEAPGESTAIASIVDTMLAELRPKLVEEIAKKMSSEKRERDREKDKEKKKKR